MDRVITRLPSLAILVALLSIAPWAAADPVSYVYNQTDATTGAGNLVVYQPGFVISGALPAATVIQNDTTAEPLPSGIVGFITGGSEANPGADVGVHLGWSGTVTLTGQVIDANDPNTATSDPNLVNFYEITVPLTMATGDTISYKFHTFDDNSSVGGSNDVNNALTHRGWIGDNTAGHRHTGPNFTYQAGADTFVASLGNTALGSSGNGDNLGITVGVGPTAPNGTLFVDGITFRGILNSAGTATLVDQRPLRAATTDVITGVSLTGTGLDPAGALVVNGGFGEDVLAFSDRTHQWNGNSGQPALAELGLVGADYIRFANDDRSVADLEAVISFEPGTKDVYLLIDTRISDTGTESILAGLPFHNTGYTVGLDENGTATGPGNGITTSAELWVLPGFEGTSLTLGPIGQTYNMYGVVTAFQLQAVPEPGTLTLLACGALGLLARLRRRQS